MGADIHMVLEKKHSGKWVGLHNFPSHSDYVNGEHQGKYISLEATAFWSPRNRNYDLFAALAGVRGSGPDPLGMPDDASPLAEMEAARWGEDGHSHSYLTLDKAVPIFATHAYDGVKNLIKDGDRDALYAKIVRHFGIYIDDPKELADYRLVFWFDN